MAKKQMFKVESGVKIPSIGKGRPMTARSQAIKGLKIGQSILCADVDRNNLAPIVHRLLGKGNYAVRPAQGGIRVWRIKCIK